MEEWYHYLLLIGVGFVVGFINTVAGGGSLISLPVLIFLGLPPAVANGTNRVAIVIQTATATAGFKSKGVSTFPFNAYLGISALLGAIIGARIAVDVDGAAFNRILAIVMVAVIVIIIFKPKTFLEEMKVLQRETTYNCFLTPEEFDALQTSSLETDLLSAETQEGLGKKVSFLYALVRGYG